MPTSKSTGSKRGRGGGMDTQEQLSSVASGNAPVLEQLAAMTLDTLDNSGLDEQTYHLVRLAALIASDAAPVSYLVNMGPAADAGVTLEAAQGVMVAISPIVGSARIASAAGKLLQAFGVAAAVTSAEEEQA
ncbi:MAG TPA: carboxymuconolactone decarboxylase family protein [Micromonosporaceae bacterium]